MKPTKKWPWVNLGRSRNYQPLIHQPDESLVVFLKLTKCKLMSWFARTMR